MKRLLAASLIALAACSPPASQTEAPSVAQSTALAPADVGAFFDCLRTGSHAIVAAHRGGPAPGYAENAIETFEHTTSQVPALLEIDIARTSDGQLVLMHDDTLDRTTTGTGEVRAHTLEEIQALQLEDEAGTALNAHPPTLRQALDWANGKTILELDVKRGVSYEDVLAVVREANAINRVIFITYSDDAAVRVHNLAPEMMLSVSMDDPADIGALAARGIDLTKVLAWTGTEEPNSALNIALSQRGVEAMFGTLGGENSWDKRFARDGLDQYAAFADTGLQLIATDRPIEAARNLDDNDGDEANAALQCLATR
ncbi:glycerophosphoryl diester phosphodiesterase [alpha proteobacterium U9-1i]|nr:glycerophosphoryl diester phosphodiesterase [alpha proteobacterium U9-1i]